jgi:hypothetical protein
MVSQFGSAQGGAPQTEAAERKQSTAEIEERREATLLEYIGPYVTRRMTLDHPALKETLTDVDGLARRRSFETAAKRFGEFRIAEERHMHLEDETLFPVIERLVGPTEAVQQGKAEHAVIRRLLNAVGASLSAWNLPEFITAHAELMAALSEHWKHEEELLGGSVKLPDKETIEAIARALMRC